MWSFDSQEPQIVSSLINKTWHGVAYINKTATKQKKNQGKKKGTGKEIYKLGCLKQQYKSNCQTK